jgi:long-chain acyl-CoA synthetase
LSGGGAAAADLCIDFSFGEDLDICRAASAANQQELGGKRSMPPPVVDYARARNLAAMFFERAGHGGDRPFLWAKRGGTSRDRTWHSTSWHQAAAAVGALAKALRARGVAPGDRVMLVAENRPEWAIADLAIMTAGGITVPAYATATSDDLRHVLIDSGARAVILSAGLAGRMLPVARDARCPLIVALDEFPIPDAMDVPGWNALLAEGGALPDDPLALAEQPGRDDIACLIYTSGTGGTPRGVMLTHANILHNCWSAFDLLEEVGRGDEVFLSFLPLSHCYEHSAGQFLAISVGAEIYYAEGADKLAANLIETKPTITTAVPRLFEAMHLRIALQVKSQPRLRRWLFEQAVALGTKHYERPQQMSMRERLLDRALDRLVRAKVRARFGGRLKALVSGGAPLAYHDGVFFHALGVPVFQGYGQTEAAPFISCNRPNNLKLHTVGPALLGVELKIAEDGEILARGPMVMKGYWGDPAGTDAVLRDGWLHTGDIGRLDEDGCLQITDRKKDLIVISGGDNISPAKVEAELTREPEIAQAMVYGDQHPHLVAVLVPEEQLARRDPEAVRAVLASALERANRRLSQLERVRGFAVASEPFEIANAMLTPTLKIRRHRIREVYRDALEALYQARQRAAAN